ncbi:MAG: nucleoside-diphosphate sugar epimerase/dehydratase [Candidatus Omnitrophica bacterium]|nr:nucleoside-diphosphate sugar epimerase/dehydratase [Candidatus Omnitrophota bacterium]
MTKQEIYQNFLLYYRKSFIIIAHFLVIAISYLVSFLLRFEFSIPKNEFSGFYLGLICLIILKPAVFWAFGLYHGLWAYASIDDLLKIIKANIMASIILITSVVILGGHGFPRSVFIIDFFLCTSLVGGLRFISRFLKEGYYRNYDFHSKKILIVGAGDTGIMLLREYRKNPSMGRVIGFMDDSHMKLNGSIHGLKILGTRKDIPRVAEKYEIDEIIVAMPLVRGDQMRDILSYCEKTQAKIKIAPQLNKILSGKLVIKPREVQPEDLLGRETVAIDLKGVSQYIKDKVVLVTGAGGSIGSEIARQIARFEPKEVILFDHHENFIYFLNLEYKVKYPGIKVKTFIGDIRDVGLLKQIFSKNKPRIVFHAAAHKHVPLMEENPVAAAKNNIFGSRNLIYAAHHYGVEKFILISTDKAVNPSSVMGLSKRVAEMILQAKSKNSKTKFMAVRFGNVLGSSGSVVPLFKKQIAEGGPVTITDPNVERYFMSAREAVMLVLQAGALGQGGELFILDMGEQIKVMDIAKNLISLSGFTLGKDIEIKIIGMRPGEKLSEELLLDKEKDKVTKHEKIYTNQPQELDNALLNKKLKELQYLAKMMNNAEVIKKMKEIIKL